MIVQAATPAHAGWRRGKSANRTAMTTATTTAEHGAAKARTSTTDATARAASHALFTYGRLLDWASATFPGVMGRWCESRARRIYLQSFQGSYDVVIGYLLAHHELLEEEMANPSSFALNVEVNTRSFEMVEQNIKAASSHLAVLTEPNSDYSGMCAVLDTVRVAHSLLNALDHSVTHMGHHGNLAETETERLLDLILGRKEWLRQQTATISNSLTSSLPATLLKDLTKTGRRRKRTRHGESGESAGVPSMAQTPSASEDLEAAQAEAPQLAHRKESATESTTESTTKADKATEAKAKVVVDAKPGARTETARAATKAETEVQFDGVDKPEESGSDEAKGVVTASELAA